MRTQEEIAARIVKEQADYCLFSHEVYVPYLDFEHAKPFLIENAPAEKWPAPKVESDILNEAKTYMAEYGWDKAMNHRGISASRTVEKMRAWMWLLGRDDLVAVCDDDTQYPQYGAPVLNAICEAMKWPIPADEAIQNMIVGRPCSPDCEEGCGR